jgi:dolichol-phosphate mannosyltransferase
MLSILTPAFNESPNLAALHARLTAAMERLGVEDWEWIVVDDHSRDDTLEEVERLTWTDRRVRGVRLSRNSGSHLAIACGLHQARGDAAVMMAADLQDPPETIEAMLAEWRKGAQIVWATRRVRPGDPVHAGFAALYYGIMRRVVGMTEMPARGADFFLIDRAAIDAFTRCDERNVSVLALVTWLGFRQAYIDYEKQPRAAGRSGWTLSRKVALVVDSVTAFTALPMRVCGAAGAVLLTLGLAAAAYGLAIRDGGPVLAVVGWMTALAGAQLAALGVMGEYLWRALDAARRRPGYFVERVVGVTPGQPPSTPGRPV